MPQYIAPITEDIIQPPEMDTQFRAYAAAHAVTAVGCQIKKVPSVQVYLRQACEAVVSGFQKDVSVGNNIYDRLSKETGFSTVLGFGAGSEFETLSNDTYPSYFSEVSDVQIAKLYSYVTNAITFGCFVNGNSVSQTKFYLDHSINYLNDKFGYASVGISDSTLSGLMDRDYSLLIQQIGASPQNKEAEITNYSFYDLSGVFDSPIDLVKMKDSESQYYMISGQLIYDAIVGGSPCDTIYRIINTPTGQKQIRIHTNTPCLDSDKYIGPPRGVKFKRIFHDGPYSSGNMTQEIYNQFLEFERGQLSTYVYEGNDVPLLSFEQNGNSFIPLVKDGGRIPTDSYGAYDIDSGEYFHAPKLFSGYQYLHIGNNTPRARVTGYDGPTELIGVIPWTGWKYARLELDEDVWGKTYSTVLTNPEGEPSRTLGRGLAFDASPYVATADGDTLYPYVTELDEQSNSVDKWRVGPPSLISENSLPYLAFFQQFESKTFSQKAEVYFRCAIGNGFDATTGSDGHRESRRTWKVSSNTIGSGRDLSYHDPTSTGANASFKIVIPSSGLDDIESKVLAIGNSMDGRVFDTFSGENAGYQYTGYYVTGADNVQIGPFDVPVVVYAPSAINRTKVQYTDVHDALVVNNVSPGAGSYYASGEVIASLSVGQVAHFNIINSGGYKGLPSPLTVRFSGAGLTTLPMYRDPAELGEDVEFNSIGGGLVDINLQQFFPYLATTGTGFYYTDQDILDFYEPYIVGNPPKNTKYIHAVNNGGDVFTTKQYAQDETGKLYEYHYFDNRIAALGLEQNNWEYPFPYPSSLESAGYSKVYKTQRTENYQPRYSRGPYAKVEKPVLYPNAKRWYSGHGADLGFPNKLNVKISIKEESLKEIYKHYEVTYLGLYSEPPFLKEMDRASSPAPFGFAGPPQEQIFRVTKNSETWDIENVDSHPINSGFFYTQPLNLVDNYWVPSDSSYEYPISEEENRQGYPTGRNGDIYDASPTFIHGILITGFDGEQAYKIYNGTGSYVVSGYKNRKAYGLYHIYSGYSYDLEAQYVRPGYSLETHSFHPEYSTGVFKYMDGESCNSTINGATVQMTNKSVQAKAGQDLIWFEEIGGRKHQHAERDGGYHSKGIIGDAWMAFNADTYGISCVEDECGTTHTRSPSEDARVFALNITETGSYLHTRGMELNPFIFSKRSAEAYVAGDSVLNNASLSFSHSGRNLIFDMGKALPLKTGTEGQYYSSSGLVLGPFDRDVYLKAHTDLTGYNEVYVDRTLTKDLYSNCSALGDPCCAETIYTAGQIIKYVPSGEVININMRFFTGDYGGEEVPELSGIGTTMIGYPTGSFVGVYPIVLDGEVESSNQFSFDVNGEEMIIYLPHTGIEELAGKTYTFTMFSRSGVLYEAPSDEDFAKYATVDGKNNKSYPTVESYWKQFHKTGGASSQAYGWREGSRISIHFDDVSPKSYDDFPYDIDSYIVPSGNCIISGNMSYHGQAESAVFTEGVVLEDATPNDLLREANLHINYMSPILDRLTGYGLISLPESGILQSAPTRQLSRVEPFHIRTNSKYKKENFYSPTFYNRFLVPAISDLKFLNPDDSIESLPPNDVETYPVSHMLISAARGQDLSDGTTNLNTRKQYYVTEIKQFYDSVSTDSVINSGYFLTDVRGSIVNLQEPESGYLIPQGTTPHDIRLGMI